MAVDLDKFPALKKVFYAHAHFIRKKELLEWRCGKQESETLEQRLDTFFANAARRNHIAKFKRFYRAVTQRRWWHKGFMVAFAMLSLKFWRSGWLNFLR